MNATLQSIEYDLPLVINCKSSRRNLKSNLIIAAEKPLDFGLDVDIGTNESTEVFYHLLSGKFG